MGRVQIQQGMLLCNSIFTESSNDTQYLDHVGFPGLYHCHDNNSLYSSSKLQENRNYRQAAGEGIPFGGL